MTSFANLKRNSNSFEKLSKAVEATSAGTENSKDDNRFWQPEVDKAGNGMAIIRFLPAPAVDGDDALPWVRTFSHGFQGPGGWFIDNCLTTLNEKCPVCEHNNTLWNSGIEANKDIVRKQKRKLTYMTNILIVSDPSNPSNEGQVRLFKFGKKIFDKINEAMNPEFADETPINPFDMWEGADFVIKISSEMVMGKPLPKYDASYFKGSSELFGGDEGKLEALYDKQHALGEWVDPANYKTYDQLNTRLKMVLGESAPRTTRETVSLDETSAPPSLKTAENTSLDEADDDDTMSLFAKLANDD